ncbi:MAG: hypothetical protein LBK60_05480 [Verrucomicrobiales bacterium]|jgi:hypothetical protein|nr:hypothetical protein [Verrucomicrobiales bacterium]
MSKNILTKLLALTLTAGALTLGGCVNPPYAPKTNVTGSAAAGTKVVFIDKDLRRVLFVDRVSDGLTDAGLLKLQAALRNTTNDETLAVQLQTIFHTADGEALYTDVGSESAWQNFTLTPGQTVYYQQNALTVSARSYTVRVRYLNRKDAGN